jgi:hypothetical protein
LHKLLQGDLLLRRSVLVLLHGLLKLRRDVLQRRGAPRLPLMLRNHGLLTLMEIGQLL